MATHASMTGMFTNALMSQSMLVAMRTPNPRTPWLSLLLLLPVATASADGRRARHHDHDEARAAVERGERVPLAPLVADALRRHPGKLIEAELDGHDYEIEILRADGRVVELEYDARTGKLIDVEIEDD